MGMLIVFVALFLLWEYAVKIFGMSLWDITESLSLAGMLGRMALIFCWLTFGVFAAVACWRDYRTLAATTVSGDACPWERPIVIEPLSSPFNAATWSRAAMNCARTWARVCSLRVDASGMYSSAQGVADRL